jgi:hypothetical protein
MTPELQRTLNDEEWISKMADLEQGCDVSAGHPLGCIGHCDPALTGVPEPYNESDTLP